MSSSNDTEMLPPASSKRAPSKSPTECKPLPKRSTPADNNQQSFFPKGNHQEGGKEFYEDDSTKHGRRAHEEQANGMQTLSEQRHRTPSSPKEVYPKYNPEIHRAEYNNKPQNPEILETSDEENYHHSNRQPDDSKLNHSSKKHPPPKPSKDRRNKHRRSKKKITDQGSQTTMEAFVNHDNNKPPNKNISKTTNIKSAMKKDQNKEHIQSRKNQHLTINTDQPLDDDEEHSNTTQKAKGIGSNISTNNQYKESASKHSEEDDINTVHSTETTKNQTKEEEATILEPINLRLQFNFTIKSIDYEKILQQVEGKQEINNETFSRIRIHLLEIYQSMKNIDKDSKLLKWSDNKEYKTLGDSTEDEDFPTDPATLALYFPGFRPKQTSGRVFTRIRIHTPNNIEKLSEDLKEWAILYGHNLNRCVIQAENSEMVGWLLYSSQYTDIDHMAKFLRSKRDWEWGLKLGPITKSDKHLNYKDRAKAMFIYVPKGFEVASASQVSSIFSSKALIPELLGIEERYQFVPPEHKMANTESRKMYTQYVDRQKVHQQYLKAHFCNIFQTDIDSLLIDKIEKVSISIREMILNITVAPDVEFQKPPNLFASIDFTSDSKRQYFDGRPGPGGPGYIITYYSMYEGEALAMIQGLGRYVYSMLGKTIAKKAFTINHFLGNEGWYWDRDNHKFITPEAKRMENNLCKDLNMLMVRKAEEMNYQERIDRSREESKDNNPNEAIGPSATTTPTKSNSMGENNNNLQNTGENRKESEITTNKGHSNNDGNETNTTKHKPEQSSHQPGTLQSSIPNPQRHNIYQNDGDSIIREKEMELIQVIQNPDMDTLQLTEAKIREDVPHIEYNNHIESNSVTSSLTAITSDNVSKSSTLASKDTERSAFDSILDGVGSIMDSVVSTGKETVLNMIHNKEGTKSAKKQVTRAHIKSKVRKLLAMERALLKQIDKDEVENNEGLMEISEDNKSGEESSIDSNSEDDTSSSSNSKEGIGRSSTDSHSTEQDNKEHISNRSTNSGTNKEIHPNDHEEDSNYAHQEIFDNNTFGVNTIDSDYEDDNQEDDTLLKNGNTNLNEKYDRDNYNDANDDEKENKEITQETNPVNTYANKGSQSNKSRCEKQADSFDVSNNKC